MSFEERYGVGLQEAVLGLDDELKATNEHGDVLACVGLFATFYAADGHTSMTRERFVAAFERYREEAGAQLKWGGDPKTGKARKLQGKGQSILDVRSWQPRLRATDDFQPCFQGGEKSGEASAYRFLSLARPDWARDHLSSLTFGLPFAWAVGKPEGAFLRLVLEMCSLLRPAHGYAGLGIHLPLTETGSGASMRPAIAMAARFRGLELEHSVAHSRELAEADAIKSINWLTVLSDPWLERLGGLGSLTAALGTEIPIHRYEGGIVIQAGPCPRLGDVQRAEPMEAYQKVALALKPLRVKRLYGLAKFQGFDEERTAQWLARFDEPLG